MRTPDEVRGKLHQLTELLAASDERGNTVLMDLALASDRLACSASIKALEWVLGVSDSEPEYWKQIGYGERAERAARRRGGGR